MASLEYDADSNALYIRLKRGKVAESEPISDNLILDLNRKGKIIGVEVLGPKPIDVKVFPSSKSHHEKTSSSTRQLKLGGVWEQSFV